MDTEANEIGDGIRTQTLHALKEADLLLFMMDGQTGVLPQDQEIARLVRETGKPVWLLVNKIDQMKHSSMAHDPAVYQLALGEPKLISANTGFCEAVPKTGFANICTSNKCDQRTITGGWNWCGHRRG
jgi:GTP-binding protein